jgi:hypothetical protein
MPFLAVDSELFTTEKIQKKLFITLLNSLFSMFFSMFALAIERVFELFL